MRVRTKAISYPISPGFRKGDIGAARAIEQARRVSETISLNPVPWRLDRGEQKAFDVAVRSVPGHVLGARAFSE
jgi:hypothetical protein